MLTITVNTLVDEMDGSLVDGDISLRDAIVAAPLGATIDFAPSLTSGGPATVLLTNGVLPTINKSLVIDGPGANLLTIDASGNDPTPDVNNGDGSRIFTISDANANNLLGVAISGITLTGGDRTLGGAINSAESLTLTNCVVSHNSAGSGATFGGAIVSSGVGATLTLMASTISANVVGGAIGGGGLSISNGNLTIVNSMIAGNSAASGGGIRMTGGILTVTDSTIESNSAGSDGGGVSVLGDVSAVLTNATIRNNISGRDGGGIYVATGTITLINSDVIQNQAAQSGGGVWGSTINTSGGTIRENTAVNGSGGGINGRNVTINGTLIADNSAANNGGGIDGSTVTIDAASIRNNSASNAGGVRGTTLTTISGSEISGNMATGSGGGIRAGVGLTISASTISGNTAGVNGGGILADLSSFSGAAQTVLDSTISGNVAGGGGGGIKVNSGQMTIDNSTISGNSASNLGGGITTSDLATVNIRFSTVTGNSAPAGKGGGVYTASGETIIGSSVVAGNMLSDLSDASVSGTLTHSIGYNLVGTGNAVASFNSPGDQAGILDPMLGTLADNGGPTKTHALLVGSPAIDAGDPTFDPGDPDGDPMTDDAVPYDQRGAPFGRVFDGNNNGVARSDIGAYELQPSSVLGDYNLNGVVDAADYVVWRKTLSTSVAPQFTGADGDGDSSVGPGDYSVWRAHFGQTLPAPGAGSGAGQASSVVSQELQAEGVSTRSISADQVGETIVQMTRATMSASANTDAASARTATFAALETGSVWQVPVSPPRVRIHRYSWAESSGNGLSLLLAIDRDGISPPQDSFVSDDTGNGKDRADDDDSEIDEAHAEELAVWRATRNTCIVLPS